MRLSLVAVSTGRQIAAGGGAVALVLPAQADGWGVCWPACKGTTPGAKTMNVRVIGKELRVHVPFTAFGAGTGVAIMFAITLFEVPAPVSTTLFWVFHPVHVLLSALVAAGMYRLHGKAAFWRTFLVGYFGSIGIATLSDSLIPYVGEALLDLPHREVHLGFIEKWWLVNPLAAAGVVLAYFRPATKLPHGGHVLLSTWASLSHMTMASESPLSLPMLAATAAFLFLSVWVPCCTSDIVFPLLFARQESRPQEKTGATRTGLR